MQDAASINASWRLLFAVCARIPWTSCSRDLYANREPGEPSVLPQNPRALPPGYYTRNDGSVIQLQGLETFRNVESRATTNESTTRLIDGNPVRGDGETASTRHTSGNRASQNDSREEKNAEEKMK